MPESRAEDFPKMSNGGGRPIIVKDWHVFLTVIFTIISITAAFISLKDQAEETARRVRDLEQRRVIERDDFENYRKAMENQLNRVEAKLDEERSTRRRQ
jgi:multidrug resistance efflux pump